MMEFPLTVTKQDGTVIQLNWKKKKEKSKPVVIKEPENKPPRKSKKLISEKDYINKCLYQIKIDLNLQEKFCKFKFYEFKGIPLLSVMIRNTSTIDVTFKSIYTMNLQRMAPTTKYKDYPHYLSDKSITKLKNIISRIMLVNKEFSL